MVFERLRSVTLFALYQAALLTGILMLPLAMVARRVGLPFLPVHRAIARLGDAYERSREFAESPAE
ncbi:hypothetical protein [Halomarina pelagica]|uniref:hypothetical protein n=1 Tax=Halomarina pelagica TaxID=2961599 RepID=UPI0020C5944D|nr:hypothetical protein [Halomarina sp. BND7]